MTRILYIIFLLVVPISLMAQSLSEKVLARNAGVENGRQTISVKWYSREIYYPEGVNIYRKSGEGEWQKLNVRIIKKSADVSASDYKRDPDLNFFIPFMNESKRENLQELFLINVLVKIFQSESFSKFLGIQYDDTTVSAGKTYRYKVNKIQGTKEITLGESTTIIAGPETIEETVKDISVKPDTNKVKITWKVEEQRFYAVNIFRASGSGSLTLVNKTPVMISKYKDSLGRLQYPKIFFIDDSLNPGIYSYQLAGLDFFGKETKRSTAFKVEVKDLIPPPAPEHLEDSINNLDVILTWKNRKSTDVAGINVFRSTKSTGPFVKLNSLLLSPSVSSYKDKVQKAGPYYYYVSVVDAAGNESKADPIFSEVHDIIPPAQPLGLIAKADTGKIYLSWQKNKEEDVAGYLIYRTINKNVKNNFALLNTNPIRRTNYTDYLPKSAKNKFLYKIIAVDSSYNKSKASNITLVQMPDVIPPVKPYLKSISNSENYFIIKWIPNKDADLKGYNIYRSSGDGKFSLINKTLILAFRDNYIDPHIESGKNYFYYLTAADSAGNESSPSNILKGYFNFSSFLSAPKELKIQFREEKKDIRISWKQENIKEILGFMVYRKEGESERMIPVSGRAASNEYYDKNITPGNTYYYEVRAYDRTGTVARSETMKISVK